MTQEIVRRETGEIVDLSQFSENTWLDPYAEGGISQEEPRLDAIATISAGYREPGKDGHAGLPKVSRDGRIYLSDAKGRAPGLKQALDARKQMGLTIAFPFNNSAGFVQQRFTEYSSTNLLAHGDEQSITQIDRETGGRKVIYAADDPDGYEAAKRRCKLTLSIYFTLAEWTEEGPRVVFPDGLGLYRIRTTSRNTQRNLRAALESVATWTHGQIAGVPFDVSLDYRDVTGPDGARRNIPCWVFVPRPPGGLSSQTFVPRLSAAVREGRLLQLPPPSAETIENAEWDNRELSDDESVVDQPTEREAEIVAGGGPCDASYWRSQWFSSVDGTRFDSDDARADYLRSFTRGAHSSLADFLAEATEAEASALLAELGRDIEDDRSEGIVARSQESAARFQSITDDDDPSWQRTKQRDAERKAALEQAGFESPTGDSEIAASVIDHEPEPAAAPTGEKSKQRLNAERNYEQLITAAGRIDIDSAPFEIDATCGDQDLATLTGKLAAAIRAKTEQQPVKA